MTAPLPSLRRYVASSFLPAMLYEVGTGAVMPILVTTATGLGATTAAAAFTMALLGLGRVIGDIPASWMAECLGDRRAMLLASGVAAVSFAVCMIAPTLLVLQVALTVLGMTSAVFYLARQSYLMEVAPVSLWARAQSTLAGSRRVGLFIGPFLGAAAISLAGVRAAYVVAIAAAIATAFVLLAVPDAEKHEQAQLAARSSVGGRKILGSQWRLFFTLGLAIAAVGAIRQAWPTVLPLWAHHIGLSPSETSIIIGIANGIDMTLFYPSGKVMDRYGRLVIALPSMLIMGIGAICLTLTHSAPTLTVIAITVSVGNGIGSGIVQTLGSDAAPVEGRRQFLGIWRVFRDVGTGLGPVIVSSLAAIFTLSAGILTAGAIALLGGAGLAAWVPRFTAFATPLSIRLYHQQAASSLVPQASEQGDPRAT